MDQQSEADRLRGLSEQANMFQRKIDELPDVEVDTLAAAMVDHREFNDGDTLGWLRTSIFSHQNDADSIYDAGEDWINIANREMSPEEPDPFAHARTHAEIVDTIKRLEDPKETTRWNRIYLKARATGLHTGNWVSGQESDKPFTILDQGNSFARAFARAELQRQLPKDEGKK